MTTSVAHGVEGDNWKAEADARIAEHRQGVLVVEVVDAQGKPLPGAKVHVQMTRHSFRFGTAVQAKRLHDAISGDADQHGADDNCIYRDKIAEHFNAAVLENGHKWRMWDAPNKQAEAVATVRWMLDQGIDVRGHTLVWQHKNPGWSLPNDVYESEDMGYIRERMRGRIQDGIIYEYGPHGRLAEWDLLNEQWSEHVLTDKLDPDVPKEEAPSLVEWFNLAHEAAPEVKLFINDYGILVGDDAEHIDSYKKTIRFLQSRNAPLHGIGFQAHFTQGPSTISPQETFDRLNRFAAFGVPLLITEFDMFGKDWEAGQKAQWLHDFMTLCFSHPQVDGFLMWGFWDGQHWQNSAPLYDKQWNLKPEGEAWMDLVFDQWWSDEVGRCNEHGRYETRVFLGDHVVTVTGSDRSTAQQNVTVTRDQDNRVVVEISR